MLRLATTKEIRDIARQAFVRATGMCYYYRDSWTDKSTLGKNFRRVGFAVYHADKGPSILKYMNDALESKGLIAIGLTLTENNYIRCRVGFDL